MKEFSRLRKANATAQKRRTWVSFTAAGRPEDQNRPSLAGRVCEIRAEKKRLRGQRLQADLDQMKRWVLRAVPSCSVQAVTSTWLLSQEAAPLTSCLRIHSTSCCSKYSSTWELARLGLLSLMLHCHQLSTIEKWNGASAGAPWFLVWSSAFSPYSSSSSSGHFLCWISCAPEAMKTYHWVFSLQTLFEK